MNCTKCGAPIQPGCTFCSSCGQKVEFNQNTQQQYAGQQQYGGQQYGGQQYGGQQYGGQQYGGQQYGGQQYGGQQYGGQQYGAQPMYGQAPNMIAVSMGWHNFLIYFVLWASGILNIINGILLFAGVTNEDAYSVLKDLEGTDRIFGFLFIGLGVFAIITRFKLAQYRSAAPMLLMLLYVGGAIVGFAYNAIVAGMIDEFSFLSYQIAEKVDMLWASAIGGVIGSGVVVIINSIYYGKRKHMFVY